MWGGLQRFEVDGCQSYLSESALLVLLIKFLVALRNQKIWDGIYFRFSLRVNLWLIQDAHRRSVLISSTMLNRNKVISVRVQWTIASIQYSYKGKLALLMASLNSKSISFRDEIASRWLKFVPLYFFLHGSSPGSPWQISTSINDVVGDRYLQT